MKEYERKQLLERVDREGSTVGTRIPDRIEVQGEPFELRDFVFEIKRRDGVRPEDRERVEEAKRQLRRERLARRQTIEDGEVSYEEGEHLVEGILGIDRALHALGSLGPTDLEDEAAAQAAADRKRWLHFLKQVLGRDEQRRPRS